jgi:5'-3' exonuclease
MTETRGIQVHLVDGTYELFRHHYGQLARGRGSSTPGGQTSMDGLAPVATVGPVPRVAAVPDAPFNGSDRAATRGVLGTVMGMLEDGATHLGVATDHVIESFRNELWAGYKTGDGVPPELAGQFPLVEEALYAMGVRVWPMVRLEADDALASAAAVAAADSVVAQVVICTPDKDLAQCVTGRRVVQMDRRSGTVRDETGVVEKFGVTPASIPDYLALVGDSADGYPGLPGWGAKSTAAVLRHYPHIDQIPDEVSSWAPALRREVKGCARLAATLSTSRHAAQLFRRLATLVVDRDLLGSVEELRWTGPSKAFSEVCARLGADGLVARATRLAGQRGA